MLEPNTLLQNRYLIVRHIGQGGMGAVYSSGAGGGKRRDFQHARTADAHSPSAHPDSAREVGHWPVATHQPVGRI